LETALAPGVAKCGQLVAQLAKFLADFSGKSRLEVREHRREKFMAIGTAL